MRKEECEPGNGLGERGTLKKRGDEKTQQKSLQKKRRFCRDENKSKKSGSIG